jgi:hypothetical protein
MSTMALPAHACRRLVVCVLALACLLTPHGSEATDGATTVHVVFSNHLDIGACTCTDESVTAAY